MQAKDLKDLAEPSPREVRRSIPVRLEQQPTPGRKIVRHRGDILRVSLRIEPACKGRAWLRTNIGHAETRRAEIIRHVEDGEPLLERDWHDIAMPLVSAGDDDALFEVSLSLLEVGRFQAKAFFEPETEGNRPVWVEGQDFVLKVEPAEYDCAPTIYAAIVRQFGENKRRGAERPEHTESIALLERAGFEVIARSGKFRDLIAELDHIIGDLGFRIVQLLPIFPPPTTYARMGRLGSPFAVLDFMEVDPALAEFDRRTTPMDQFGELVDEIHRRQAKLFLDIPINHTGWASWLQNHHPEWFKRQEDARFASPGAWGVIWGDLAELDYHDRKLWRYMAEVFLLWCRRGVDGFRCDAGYMIPLPVWEYITSKVRTEFPDTIFLLEGLGGDKKVVFELLDKANLNWAYSELFQNYRRSEVEAILQETIEVSSGEGLQTHFSETHDNNRLAVTSETWSWMRTALAALASHSGGFGITCGVEWFATEKIDVHQARSLNWGNDVNQIAGIKRLNALLAEHPAFWHGAHLATIHQGKGTVLALRRTAADGGHAVLVLVNLDAKLESPVKWRAGDFSSATGLRDLLSGKKMKLADAESTPTHGLILAPGEVLCLSAESSWLEALEARKAKRHGAEPARSLSRRRRAKVLELYHALQSEPAQGAANLDAEEAAISHDPHAFCRRLGGSSRPAVVRWRWPADLRRIVMWPPRTALVIECGNPFIAELRDGENVLARELSFPRSAEGSFAVMAPLAEQGTLRKLTMGLTVFSANGNRRAEGELLVLPETCPAVLVSAEKNEISERRLYGLCTNGRGAMSHVRGHWGEILTQYDALLAANPHPDYPVDRRILLTRVRAWLVYRDYSREINAACVRSFSRDAEGRLCWRFFVPLGMGMHVRLTVLLTLIPGKNAVEIGFHRERTDADDEEGKLGDRIPVKLILRPDIEDRNFHDKTKAHRGPEGAWPAAVSVQEAGFDFHPPGGCGLQVRADGGGRFTSEPEWLYMVGHPIDAQRGLDGSSDLFSPGYFTFFLQGGGTALLQGLLPGEDLRGGERPSFASASEPVALNLFDAAKRAIGSFIVARDETRTVIAGYPWFLDWGRDTLICLRGIIAAGMLSEARDIIRQFAQFEEQGTLTNMIRGHDVSNRDTSDAPLWLFVACADLRRVDGNDDFLDADCGNGRRLKEVLCSIARGLLNGTPNGIRVDEASALIFSPSHFTWMDTNLPAGTPREGYPIEIQALWHAALSLLDELEPGDMWNELRKKVADSILRLFWHVERGYFSDCLHASSGQPAVRAVADDHLRPNQLFAVTLGAVTDPVICRSLLDSCEELLVPGAIRSLADRRVWYRLPIHHGDGRLLNDPFHPYCGRYEGDEDTHRKPAYHNGTAWTWPFPSYAEALFLTYGEAARSTAIAYLSSSVSLFNDGCLAELPEVLDGNAPHAQRGCGAQAWAVTELCRVLALLDSQGGLSV